MPGRRAQHRLPRLLRGLPAILLSGVFMLVTAGLPAVAATARADDRAADSEASLSGSADSIAAHDLPGAVVTVSSFQDDPDTAAPPPSSWTTVDPLDLYPPAHLRSDAAVGSGEHDRTTTDPVRGPPATQWL